MFRPPVIKGFEPRSVDLNVFLGDTLQFSIFAIDLDKRSLDYRYTVEDSLVSDDNLWEYVIDDTGSVDVVGLVSNPGASSTVHWRIHRLKPANLPPVVTSAVPEDRRPSIIIGDAMEFEVGAEDPEGKPLDYLFTVNDSIVATARRYTYQSTYIGLIDVTAIITDREAFVFHEWTLNVTAEPDSILPTAVEIVSLETGAAPGQLDIEWIAVGDDGMEGLPAHYVVRTSAIPITDEYRWSTASDRQGEPPPAQPGELQSMVIQSLNPGTFVYVAVRAQDDFGNLSPLANTEGALVKGLHVQGTVRHAVTNQGIPGIAVHMAGLADTTDPTGLYVLPDLPVATTLIRVKDENVLGRPGDYFNIDEPGYVITHQDVRDFWVIPNDSLETGYYNHFMDFFRHMTDTFNHPFGNILRTWNLPIQIYVRPLVWNGLDYAALIRESFLDWEAQLEMDLFEFVDAEPDVGVFTIYRNDISRDLYEVLVHDEQYLPILARISFRMVYEDTPDSRYALATISRHEIGHVLGMKHSDDKYHIMVGGRAPANGPIISRDEIWLGKAMYHIPRAIPVDWYKNE